MASMTKQSLRDICLQQKLYRTPALNDKIYLNFKGFTKIENLEEYSALKALFLEGNALDSIEGLPELKELRCLFLQQNCIAEISHLEGVTNLDQLNLSHNAIKNITGLSVCPMLTSLIMTDNQLETIDSIQHLTECKNLTTVDLQNNRLTDPAIIEIFKQLPNLQCLYLKGNPVVTHMKNYRKTLIAALPKLGYLDDRPVFEDERRLVTAWAMGGLEAEREERKLIKEEKEAADRRNFEAMLEIRKEGFRRRRERLGLAPGDTDPALDEISDEEYQFEEEPPELVEARKRLAAYTSRQGEEEPAELSEARHALVKGGGTVQEGNWKAHQESDSDIYFASIRNAQASLSATDCGDQTTVNSHGRDPKDQCATVEDVALPTTVPMAAVKQQIEILEVDDDARPAADTTDKASRTAAVTEEMIDLCELD